MTKGPVLTGVRQARCEAGFDMTRQRRKKKGEGGRDRGCRRTEERQQVNNNQAH